MSSEKKESSFWSVKEDKDEAKEFETGPMSVLLQSVKSNSQVHIKLLIYNCT